MESLQRVFDWLASLDPVTLYGVMTALAFVENIFPPIPADVLVAFGGLLAARAGNPAWPAFLAVWGGNMVGAALIYVLGWRFGSARVERRYHLATSGAGDAKIAAWHQRYGVAAFFFSRFVPGLRAIAPAVAGALRIPPVAAMGAIAAASALWYGFVTWAAFRAGGNWDAILGRIASFGRWSALLAAALIVAAAAWWFRRRQRA